MRIEKVLKFYIFYAFSRTEDLFFSLCLISNRAGARNCGAQLEIYGGADKIFRLRLLVLLTVQLRLRLRNPASNSNILQFNASDTYLRVRRTNIEVK